MNRVYETLKNNPDFAGKLTLYEEANCLTVVFHEYLRFEYIGGNYTATTDEGLLLLNNDLTH